jgi:hypothetical protein
MNTDDKNITNQGEQHPGIDQFERTKKSAKPGYLGSNSSPKDSDKLNKHTEKDKDKQSQPGRKEIHRDGGQRK